MRPSRDTTDRRQGLHSLVRLLGIAAFLAAVVKELRTPRERRTWHGALAGVVPYDLRPPTAARLRRRMWAPDDAHLIVPRAFGVGWTLNVGRIVALVRRRARG